MGDRCALIRVNPDKEDPLLYIDELPNFLHISEKWSVLRDLDQILQENERAFLSKENNQSSIQPVKRINEGLRKASSSSSTTSTDSNKGLSLLKRSSSNEDLNVLKGYDSYDGGSPPKKLKRLHSTPNVSAAGLTTWKQMLQQLAR